MSDTNLADEVEAYVPVDSLLVSRVLFEFISNDVIPGTEVDPSTFWTGLSRLVSEFLPRINAQLVKRDVIQAQIDEWHRQRKEDSFNVVEYQQYLEEIGYLQQEGAAFTISTSNVDSAISTIAGPQLVVPINNARYALNAANARWGSLYDALYGTDVIPTTSETERGTAFNQLRANDVIAYTRNFLDETFPLAEGSHHDSVRYFVDGGALHVTLKSGNAVVLKNEGQFVGYQGTPNDPLVILLSNNGLHAEIVLNRNGPIGTTDLAGINDVLLESALSTIMDCEDSVAAVDSDDKVLVYRNWLGLMNGDLTASFEKGGKTVLRRLASDRSYNSPDGTPITLPGRSIMLVRVVSDILKSTAVLDQTKSPVPEGILDAMIVSLIAKHDLIGTSTIRNSAAGSVYIVKPKMHGPEEVGTFVHLLEAVESILGLRQHTLKIGIMDEERRTTVNLKECIRAAKERVVFINTGFLDRTGDEIHTCMEAGPMLRKGDMKTATWIRAYENWNVDIGLECGFRGKAQIGKGMWAMPDRMAEMIQVKMNHPLAGANCAWVPSPTAATLHAMHYHKINVPMRQQELMGRGRAAIAELLSIPVSEARWTPEEIQNELDNNIQGILGYVVRWVDFGIGCSKVLDINNIGLMEDRATLRISSQHVANWLHHGICSHDQVVQTLRRMAAVVDAQNAGDTQYRPMAPDMDGNIAFQSASDLIFHGRSQPNGYTEVVLQTRRMQVKARDLRER